MNEKQAKLLRYFAKHSGDKKLAGQIQKGWHTLTHRKKGKLTRWIKKVIVTMMAVSMAKRLQMAEDNQKILEGFVTV